MLKWIECIFQDWGTSNWLNLILVIITAVYVFLTNRISNTMRDEAHKTARARLHDLLYRLQAEYKTAEMLLAIDALWNFYHSNANRLAEEYERLRKSDQDRISGLPPERQTIEVTGTLHYRRRIVSHFYQFLAALRKLEGISDDVLYTYWPEKNLRIIPNILIPIEMQLAKSLNTDSSEFRAMIGRLNKLYEDSKCKSVVKEG